MKACKACGTKARKLYRAIVLSPSNRATAGNVCATCKRLGWLLVFSEGVAAPPKRTTRERLPRVVAEAAAADVALKRWGIK